MKKSPVSVVTGAAGFLGSHLTDLLLARGHKVIGLDNFVTGNKANLAHLRSNKNFRFIQQDICDPIAGTGSVDYVWNFASPASPIDYLQIPIETLKVGVGVHGIRRDVGVPRIVRRKNFAATGAGRRDGRGF